jgi:hypothetical protein
VRLLKCDIAAMGIATLRFEREWSLPKWEFVTTQFTKRSWQLEFKCEISGKITVSTT